MPTNNKEKFCQFQSTLPTRGSDANGIAVRSTLIISIHAPHEGERLNAITANKIAVISIHAPHEGERLAGVW